MTYSFDAYTNTPHNMIDVTINGETRKLEVWFLREDEKTGLEHWITVEDVANFRIGHGTKLWLRSLNILRNPITGEYKISRSQCINNRYNTTLIGWDELEATDRRRSQHIGQVSRFISK